MSKKNVGSFFKQLVENDSLFEEVSKLKATDKSQLINLASKKGFDFTIDELNMYFYTSQDEFEHLNSLRPIAMAICHIDPQCGKDSWSR